MSDDQLARRLLAHLRGGGGVTVPEIAAALGESEPRIVAVLDSYRVDEHGDVAHAGVGEGGGWLDG